VQVWFSEMEISVDRRQLVAEHESPLSLLASLSSALVQCACRLSCCAHSVLGSWSGKLLWIPLPRRSADDSYPAAVHSQNAVSRKKKLFSGEAKNALCATVSFRLVSNTGKSIAVATIYRPRGGETICPPPMSVRLTADQLQSADGSAVRTSLPIA